MTIQLHSNADAQEFAQGFDDYIAGRWHSDRWKTFRLRFGIYEQRQSGLHMIRVKQPGGQLSFAQARTIAQANDAYAGGDIHITTRQGIQLYFIAQDSLANIVAAFNAGGVTTREASGNTFRAITACPHAGFCADQIIDASDVAAKLTAPWLRHPLTQHMPRKFKITVSGCAKDCGLSAIDDLGFIATQKDGQKGFRVVAGGGLGIKPAHAVEVFDFVTEADLTRVQEAVARLHNEQSDRTNKNRARIKFLVKRFGRDGFVARVREQFDALEGLDAPALQALDWKGYVQGARAHVEVEVPLGWLSSKQLLSLADLGERHGAQGVRLTRAQNLIVHDLPETARDAFVKDVGKLGLDASGRKHVLNNFVACPGASTCAIGITDSFALAESLLDAHAEFADLGQGAGDVSIRVSGCHNSCGHHHIADIGFHGLAKKIDGKPAPHYQLHLGGSAAAHGIVGPVIPAHRVKRALRALLVALKVDRADGETVRAWAERLGADAIAAIVAPALEDVSKDAHALRFDIGHDALFEPPATSTGECAAGAVVAEHLADLARLARQDAKRAFDIGRLDEVRVHLELAFNAPLKRLLVISGADGVDVLGREGVVRDQWSHDTVIIDALDAAKAAVSSHDIAAALPALEHWQATADGEVERILSAVPGYLAKSFSHQGYAGAAQ